VSNEPLGNYLISYLARLPSVQNNFRPGYVVLPAKLSLLWINYIRLGYSVSSLVLSALYTLLQVLLATLHQLWHGRGLNIFVVSHKHLSSSIKPP